MIEAKSDTYEIEASDALQNNAEQRENIACVCDPIVSNLTQPRSLDVPELRRHLKMHSLSVAPVLRPHLLTLEQQLKSWDEEGNRDHLRKTIARTVLAIENLRQPSGEQA